MRPGSSPAHLIGPAHEDCISQSQFHPPSDSESESGVAQRTGLDRLQPQTQGPAESNATNATWPSATADALLWTDDNLAPQRPGAAPLQDPSRMQSVQRQLRSRAPSRLQAASRSLPATAAANVQSVDIIPEAQRQPSAQGPAAQQVQTARPQQQASAPTRSHSARRSLAATFEAELLRHAGIIKPKPKVSDAEALFFGSFIPTSLMWRPDTADEAARSQ